MRCSECDGLAVPQAIGRLPDGRLAFGYCLRCLERAGATGMIVSSAGSRKRRGRMRQAAERARKEHPAVASRRGVQWRVPVQRRQLLLGVSGMMLAWGLSLGSIAVLLPLQGNAGRGIPGLRAILLVASGLAGLVGLSLLLVALEPGRRTIRALFGIQVVASLTALGVLVGGIVAHDPRRDVLIIAIVTAALATAALARRGAAELEPSQKSPSPELL